MLIHLTQVFEIIQGLAGEEVEVGDFPEISPPCTVRSKHKILIVISYVLSSGVGRPATKIRIMNLQKLLRHGGRRRHHNVHKAQFEVHERAVGSGQGCEGVVRHGAHMGKVSYYWPWFWARREWE